MNIPNIPGYDILAALPQGGMSAVFKARQISLDRVVAIKMLPPAMAADTVDFEKFLTEAKITAQLKHPNIVRVYDFGKTPEGVYYFVMEFISGYSVAEWILRKKRLSLKDTLVCAQHVAEALHYAWETFGIVHCDIKPDNVMIDSDGTVKVADLGLARSVRSVMDKAKSGTGVVVGTPYYISPEQSQGHLDLDCRADIYSLGAMLYHCLSGNLPFEGLPLLKIMDCQITDQIPDLMDLEPHVSIAAACLIEKMLAKNPVHRQKDWQEVIRDMIRVRSDLLPKGPLPPPGASTMKRNPARAQRLKELDAAASSDAGSKRPGGRPIRKRLKLEWVAAGIMLLAVAASSLVVGHMLTKPKGSPPVPPRGRPAEESASGSVSESQASVDDKTSALAQHRIETAQAWCRENPDKVAEGIRQFERIAKQFEDTPYAQAARDEIGRIRERQRAAQAAEMKALRDTVQPLVARQKWREAADQYESYEGRFKAETAAERAASIREWRDRDKAHQAELRQAAEAKKQEQQRQWEGVLNDVAAHVVEGNAGAALAIVHQATNQAALAENRTNLTVLAAMLADVGNMDQRLMDSFRSQKDQEITIALTNGPERLVVRKVQDDMIFVDKIIVVSAGQLVQSKVLRLQDVSLEEKVARLGIPMTPSTALVQGSMALRDGDWAAAETAWRQAGSLLSAPLTAKLTERTTRQREDQARATFRALLRAAQIDGGDEAAGVSTGAPAKADGSLPPAGSAWTNEPPVPGCEVCLAAVYRKKYPPRMAALLAAAVADYQAQHGQTAFAQSYAPVLAALKQSAATALETNAPAPVSTSAVPVRTGPADSATVRQELFIRNPGLTEFNVSLMTDAAGHIVRAEIISADLKDIKPLAGLSNLIAVVCAVTRLDEWRDSSVHAPLADLSPLKGLSLQELCVSHTRVKDLAPLAGMPLTRLNLAGTRVTDVSVLKGMPLQELSLSHLAVQDIKPLAGMPLEFLNISYTDVSDVSPLSGMKLKRLLAAATRIRDITVLAGMPLKDLGISRTDVSDLIPLAGMPLDHLNVSATRVRDLSPLAAMPLRGLDASKTDVRELSPLRGLALETLNLRGTRIKELNALRNMPLKRLDIAETAVRDLAPIQNSSIEEIWLDYNPYQQTPVDTFRAFSDVLSRMPRLQKVNGAVDFQERRSRE